MRRIAAATALTAALAASLAFSPAASASNVAWNVTIGGPGFAVSAGQPAFRGGGYWGGGFRPVSGGCFNCGWNRTWIRPVVSAPIFVPPPTFAPVFVAPRPVFVAPRPVLVRRPVVVGTYWPR